MIKDKISRLEASLASAGIALKYFEITDSTNNEAKKHVLNNGNQNTTLFLANEQSGGRGRLGRSFLSRRGQGLYMSLLCFTDRSLADIVSVTTAAAVAVALSIEEATGHKMMIKWVNDVYNDSGKVSGILTETVAVGDRLAVIVGIGINIGDIDFPDELKNIASSIGDVSGRETELVCRIVKRLTDFFSSPRDRSYMDDYRKRFMLQGKHVDLFVGGENVDSGRVSGVDDDGGLIYFSDRQNKSITVRSGEVSIKTQKGL
jgi:BirA family biotin operon repressor/biotin-[acetyl-CoA-carboxylase] ligase